MNPDVSGVVGIDVRRGRQRGQVPDRRRERLAVVDDLRKLGGSELAGIEKEKRVK